MTTRLAHARRTQTQRRQGSEGRQHVVMFSSSNGCQSRRRSRYEHVFITAAIAAHRKTPRSAHAPSCQQLDSSASNYACPMYSSLQALQTHGASNAIRTTIASTGTHKRQHNGGAILRDLGDNGYVLSSHNVVLSRVANISYITEWPPKPRAEQTAHDAHLFMSLRRSAGAANAEAHLQVQQ